LGLPENDAPLTNAKYPDMTFVESGWTTISAYFKAEGDDINIGLGRDTALVIFNDGNVDWDVVPDVVPP